MEQPCRAVEIKEYPVDYADIDTPRLDLLVTVPVDFDYYKLNTEGTHKVHDFGQAPEIIFLLHIIIAFRSLKSENTQQKSLID